MSYQITEDRDALPAALLPLVKSHLNIDFADDDALITSYAQFAIDYRQRFVDQQWFGAAVEWLPPGTLSSYPCPVRPVSAFTVSADTVDVSAEYELRGGAPTAPVFLSRIDGTGFHAGAVVTLTAGYADTTALPPAELGNILRVTATLYEHRESMTALSLDQMPFWMNDALGGLWVPRA